MEVAHTAEALASLLNPATTTSSETTNQNFAPSTNTSFSNTNSSDEIDYSGFISNYSSESDYEDDDNTAMIAGISVAVIFVIALVAVIILCRYCKKGSSDVKADD